MDSAPDARTHLRRSLALALPCLATVVAAVGLAWWYRAPLKLEGTRRMTLEKTLVPALDRWASTAPSFDRPRGVFFGDSLTMSLDDQDGSPARARRARRVRAAFGLPALVTQVLESAGVRVQILSLTHAAFRPLQLAFVLEEVLAGQPRFAVIEINLRQLSPAWEPGPALRFLPLSRRLSLGRELALRPVLRGEGLGLLHPTIYRLQEVLSLLYVVDGLRLVSADALERLAREVQQTLGIRSRRIPAVERLESVLPYAPDPGRHPTAGVLRGIREALVASRVQVLFYVSPLVPASMAAGTGSQIASGIEGLRQAIGATPEEWLDLHAGLPEAGFRDLQNHLSANGLHWVAAQLSQRLLDAGAVSAAQAESPAERSDPPAPTAPAGGRAASRSGDGDSPAAPTTPSALRPQPGRFLHFGV